MPVFSGDDFSPTRLYRSGHFSTLGPYLFGRWATPVFERVRIETPDDDFLDVDFIRNSNRHLIVLCHGLEGSSKSNYISHYADFFSKSGFDVLAMNYRGCSGEMNRQFHMYNSGKTDDLHHVISSFSAEYDNVSIVGFSLGGNLTLKYLGDGKYLIPENVAYGVAISVPLHLSDASHQMLNRDNFLYQLKFLRTLRQKVKHKHQAFPDRVAIDKLPITKTVLDFDEYFTAPMYGFSDAEDYYAKSMSLPYLDKINHKSLIINALNDPFLGPKCYPHELVGDLDEVNLITPKYGGHVGFVRCGSDRSWLDNKILSFITQ